MRETALNPSMRYASLHVVCDVNEFDHVLNTITIESERITYTDPSSYGCKYPALVSVYTVPDMCGAGYSCNIRKRHTHHRRYPKEMVHLSVELAEKMLAIAVAAKIKET